MISRSPNRHAPWQGKREVAKAREARGGGQGKGSERRPRQGEREAAKGRGARGGQGKGSERRPREGEREAAKGRHLSSRCLSEPADAGGNYGEAGLVDGSNGHTAVMEHVNGHTPVPTPTSPAPTMCKDHGQRRSGMLHGVSRVYLTHLSCKCLCRTRRGT